MSKIKNVIIDLDNTIFNSKEAEDTAFEFAVQEFCIEVGLTPDNHKLKFYEIMNNIRSRPTESISAEDRLLYFSELIRRYSTKEKYCHTSRLLDIYSRFENKFFENLTCYENAIDFLHLCQSNGVKIVAGTNNLLMPQLKRLKQLNIATYFTDIISCQEVGVKKPDINFFHFIIEKMNFQPELTCMIGDNLTTDGGAARLGIQCFIYSKDLRPNCSQFTYFNNFNQLPHHIFIEGKVIESCQ